ncbi:MAG: gliding motility-associated C-terminal domain-containing protein [Bacteroidales bacterium]|nr:gliding motility-associated C-terminal domain-containing protein [Bacteroidales bacterium]
MLKRVVIIIVFAMLAGGRLAAQDTQDTIELPQLGSMTVRLRPGESVVVQDPGGNGNYPPQCDTRLNVVSDSGTALVISGWVALDSPNDLVGVFNYRQDVFYNVVTRTGNQTIDVSVGTGMAIIYFFSNDFIENRGFQLTVRACGLDGIDINSFHVDTVTATTAGLSWTDASSASEWTVRYGENPAQLITEVGTRQPNVTLTGLRPHKNYYVKVFNNRTYTMPDSLTRIWNFKTVGPPPVECIPFDQLESEWVTCRYGRFNNPDQNEGVINSVLLPMEERRHVVIDDTTLRDPNTGGLLRMVPEGFATSVRLGNPNIGAQAESIHYEYIVDTAITPLLILRYAAVLQNPSHIASAQPKFSFDIFDINGLSVDSRCYTATFVADTSLGWNVYVSDEIGDTALWNDWTAVGIDLAPLHGQTIFIRLSTYDCAGGAHFGYAYFTLECGAKAVRAENCGDAEENVFYAPEGFVYSWFENSAPGDTLGRERSLTVNQTGEYVCTLGFVGAGSGEQCSFDVSASSGYRYPQAAYEVRVAGTSDCQSFVRLVNLSEVTTDAEGLEPTGMPCEEVWWSVDDGAFESSSFSPLFLMPPGLHRVTMVAMAGGGSCADTASGTFWLSNPCNDTLYAHACAGTGYRFFDTVLYLPGVYERDSAMLHRTLFLDFGQTYDTAYVHITIPSSQLPFRWGGETFLDSVSHHVMNLRDRWGCDSIAVLDLTVVDQDTYHVDTVLCNSQLPMLWGDTVINQGGLYSMTFQNVWGYDSIVEMQVSVMPDWDVVQYASVCKGLGYTWVDGHTYYEPTTTPYVVLTSSAGCDSVVHLHLSEAPGVVAAMDITPEIVDFDDDLVELRDVSSHATSRLWHYGEETDTQRVVLFRFPRDVDSLRVLLVAKHNDGCLDSAWGVVVADHATVWVPNVFTPDEEQNRDFGISATGLLAARLCIFNRQGLLVACLDALEQRWDGTSNGVACPQGAYVWQLDYTTQAQPRNTLHAKGTVLLLR